MYLFREERISQACVLLVVILLSQPNLDNARVMFDDELAVEELKFTRSCPEESHRYHTPSGNFLCVIHTAKECFNACQEVGCNEWHYYNMIPSQDESRHEYNRCRCLERFKVCLYHPVPQSLLDFEVK